VDGHTSRLTKAKLKYVMSDVYQHAIRYGWLRNDENPLLAVRQSAKRERVPETLEAHEFRALILNLPQKIRTMGIICATTGLRISEVLGLKWSDIVWKKLEVKVSRSVVYARVGKCKTEVSRQPVPLDELTAEELSKWRGDFCQRVDRRKDASLGQYPADSVYQASG